MKGLCNRCNKCNLHMSCKGCSACEAPFCKKDCYQCFSLCPKRGGSFNYLLKLGGGEIKLLKNKAYDLPYHIPILPCRLTEPLMVNKVIGINGANVFSRNGEKINKRYRKHNLKLTLNLHEDMDVEGVLEFYVKDRTLEGFWDNRYELYDELKKMNLKAIISPNFSVYEDAPRIDHLYNIKRSSIVYNEMIERQLPAIPDIGWYNLIDLDQWIREINANDLKTIAFSFQVVNVTLKASNLWLHYLMGFKYLCKKLNPDVQIIVVGAVAPKRVELIKKAAGDRKLIVLNQSAYMQSQKGLLSDGRKKAPESMTRNEIFIENLKYFNREYKNILKEKKEINYAKN